MKFAGLINPSLYRIACCVLFSTSLAATAQAQSTAFSVDNLPNIASIGVGIAPDYVGSDDDTVVAGPSGRLTFDNHRYIKLVGPTVTSNLIDHDIFRLGPALNYRFGRSDVDDQVVNLMEDIDGTVELGLNAGLHFTNALNPRYQFAVNLEVFYDVGGEHEDIVSNLSVSYWRPLVKAFTVGMVAGTQYGGDDFANNYFGVSAVDSARSGLPRFIAEGGFNDVSLSLIGVLHLGPTWHIGGGVHYQYLMDEIADSPIVATRGSRDQLIAGIGLAYAW